VLSSGLYEEVTGVPLVIHYQFPQVLEFYKDFRELQLWVSCPNNLLFQLIIPRTQDPCLPFKHQEVFDNLPSRNKLFSVILDFRIASLTFRLCVRRFPPTNDLLILFD
jgi:hypothetical protein